MNEPTGSAQAATAAMGNGTAGKSYPRNYGDPPDGPRHIHKPKGPLPGAGTFPSAKNGRVGSVGMSGPSIRRRIHDNALAGRSGP